MFLIFSFCTVAKQEIPTRRSVLQSSQLMSQSSQLASQSLAESPASSNAKSSQGFDFDDDFDMDFDMIDASIKEHNAKKMDTS